MTNGEWLRQMTDNELARFLCSKLADCECCLALRECRIGHNGIASWLQKDYEYEERKETHGDLISRQAATSLPVMPKEHRNYQTYNLDDAYEQGWDDALECMRGLPSAEPEIVRCRECKHWDKSRASDWKPNCHYCPMIDTVCGENWYCADAERRTDETD